MTPRVYPLHPVRFFTNIIVDGHHAIDGVTEVETILTFGERAYALCWQYDRHTPKHHKERWAGDVLNMFVRHWLADFVGFAHVLAERERQLRDAIKGILE